MQILPTRIDIRFDCIRRGLLLGTTLRRYFTTGVLALLPTAATIWVIATLAKWVDGVIVQRAFYLFQRTVLDGGELPPILKFSVGFLAILIVLIAITGLGMLTRNVAGRYVLGLVDVFFTNVPFANKVYTFVKGIIESVSLVGAEHFDKVVAIEYPRKGVHSIGFVSRRLTESFLKGVEGERIAVFIPTSPNPTSGFIIIADQADTLELDLTPEDALKFIVSGGVVLPGGVSQEQDSKV